MQSRWKPVEGKTSLCALKAVRRSLLMKLMFPSCLDGLLKERAAYALMLANVSFSLKLGAGGGWFHARLSCEMLRHDSLPPAGRRLALLLSSSLRLRHLSELAPSHAADASLDGNGRRTSRVFHVSRGSLSAVHFFLFSFLTQRQ